jgi:tetratricopeptide (TPR) repeat protein
VSGRAAALVTACLLAAAACRRDAAPATSGASAAQALVEQGRYDEAIASLGAAADAESLYLLGRAWEGKARGAPVPTPAPGVNVPAGTLFKPEEERALEFFLRAVAARSDHAGALLAIADLLAPHALARLEAGKTGGIPAASMQAPGPDASVERVLRAYGDAVQADAAAPGAVEAMIRFATRAGRLAEADAAFQELMRRRREDPDLLVRYGDFLVQSRQTPEDALSPYAQALIWRPDDAATKLKMADIHLKAAAALLTGREWARAEARLKEARKFVATPGSPEAGRLKELEQVLRDVRGR